MLSVIEVPPFRPSSKNNVFHGNILCCFLCHFITSVVTHPVDSCHQTSQSYIDMWSSHIFLFQNTGLGSLKSTAIFGISNVLTIIKRDTQQNFQVYEENCFYYVKHTVGKCYVHQTISPPPSLMERNVTGGYTKLSISFPW